MRMLAWSTIRATMYVGNGGLIQSEYERLSQDVIRLAEIGDDRPDLGCDFYPGTRVDTNLLHQIFHLTRLHDWHSIPRWNTILEVGGGVGSMALAARRMGFEGAYFIVDFPEFLVVQRNYLKHHLSEQQMDMTGFYTPEEFDQLLPAFGPVDLLIGMASLSEMPVPERRRYLEGIQPYPDRFLMFVQQEFNGIDNMRYFGTWMQRKERTGFRAEVTQYHYHRNCWYIQLHKKERMKHGETK